MNPILIALSEIEFGHPGGGTSEKQHFRVFFRLILYFKKYFQTFIFLTLFRFGVKTSKSYTTNGLFCIL